MRVLFCPAHYVYDDANEGSEFSWAFNIADRISSIYPDSVVVTGRSTVGVRRYRIVGVGPGDTRINFGLTHAFAFNARYTVATFRALHHSRFDLVHHVLPFAIGRTYNLAALRRGSRTPFVIGPVQAPLAVQDADLDPTNVRSYVAERQTGLASLRRSAANAVRGFVSDVAPLVLSGISAQTVRSAAAVIAVNDESKALLVRSGVSASRVVVIPPGVDSKRFEPASAGWTRGDGVELLSVSHLVKRKNVDVIIRAFAKVAEVAPQATLRIVGDGPEREALTGLAHALGVRARVTFTGFVPNAAVHAEYQGADIFVNASAAEGFGSTCLEALAAGLPVVSTKVGGFANAVQDHRNGYLLNRADAEELAATLGRLVEDPILVAELSGRAREVAQREFDWDTAIIPRYLDVYERVIRGRLRPDEVTSLE